MPKFFVKNNQINDNSIIIIGKDVNHISNVVRMKIGEEIHVCDIDCKIKKNRKRKNFL